MFSGYNRYVYIAPNGDGRWKLWGEEDNQTWTEEVFSTIKQAQRGIGPYTKLLGWEPRTYIKSFDC